MTTYLHFTLGPVQSFVAQARRTRDFWAGSFLLSWLSAVAMREVRQQGGEVIFPSLDQAYLNWLDGKGMGEAPQQGRIPNRFKARFAGKADGKVIEAAVCKAWRGLADRVYQQDLRQHATLATKAIWDRQVERFWDITWVVTDTANDNGALDRRKNWRTYLPPDEPGIKCMMMDGWQELSGLPEVGQPYPSKTELDKFWQPLQERMKTDLRAGEMLSAIAFIKRRFVRHFEQVPMGWTLPPNVPSVAFMAGVHWLESILKATRNDEAVKQAWETYLQAGSAISERQEWKTRIRCLEDLPSIPRHWKAVDGNLFYRSALENPHVFPDEAKANKVASALANLNKVAGVAAASPFYAVLRMDGDDMGKLLRQLQGQDDGEKRVSDALDTFTQAVPNRVADHNGFLIYAGGDDVLAILPLENALACAARLRECYLAAFAGQNLAGGSTLSGAICFAHIKMPLSRVLEDSHDLLDSVAKAQTGRDAIAVRVLKPGGQTLQWAQPWAIALHNGAASAPVVISQLAENFQKADETEAQFSNKFFYKIHEYFGVLAFDRQNSKNHAPAFSEDDVLDLVMMAFRNSGRNRTLDVAGADLPQQLLRQCLPHVRQVKGETVVAVKQTLIPDRDGAMLVRFLAQKGAE